MCFNDSDKDDEENELEQFLLINELEKFIKESYIFSIVNLNASLSVDVLEEKDLIKKNDKKEEIMEEFSKTGIDDEEVEDWMKIYPLELAKEILEKKIQVNEEKEYLITTFDLMKSTEEISKGMLFALFAKMQKEGDLELYWNAEMNDFCYGPKNKQTKNEVDIIKKNKKRKPKEK